VSENSKIEWTDYTFNPWMGCTKVSPGCANCYAEALIDRRYGKAKWGKGQPRVRTSAANWKLPLKWNRWTADIEDDPDVQYFKSTGVLTTTRPRVFCASLADWLDDEVPIEWLGDLLSLIYSTPNLDWLLLTKRPGNFHERLRNCVPHDAVTFGMRHDWLHGYAPANVWLGSSVEDQKRADERIPELLKIPARVRFLSVEPMLGPIDFTTGGYLRGPAMQICPTVNWVIFGGESGAGARPCNIEWIRDGVRQCRAAGVAPFVKQLGSVPCYVPKTIQSGRHVEITKIDGVSVELPILKLNAKKGGDVAEWPEDLRVREFSA